MNSLATLWVGQLGPIERASLWSFAHHGQKVVIYSYTPLEQVPKGIENRDANEVMPSDRVHLYSKEQSPSLHSNFFRYALMARTEHTWVDLDIIARRPFHFSGAHVFGRQNESLINCAVLRLPQGSAALADLLTMQPGMRGIAPHIQGLRRAKYWMLTLGRGVPIEQWPWGATGPRALTTCLVRHGEDHHCLPIEAFYPIPVADTARFLSPGEITDDSFTDATLGVHLSLSVVQREMRKRGLTEYPPGSYIATQVAQARRGGFME